jgi:zinc transport system substrate-binding protein
MVPAGASHETYEPTPRQIQELSQADLYFRVGMPFEDAWMNKIQANNPKMKIIDTRQGIVLLGLSDPVEGGRSSKDPHIWMDPNLVKIQARTIASALTSGDPAHQAEYTQNLLAFEAQLTQLDRNLRTILSQVKNPRFMVFHPAWGYFAQAYGLTQISVENEGKEPGPRSLEAIIQTAKQQGIKTVFVQKPFNTRSANMIAQAIHGHVVPMDPMSPDYFANLIAMAKLIAEG